MKYNRSLKVAVQGLNFMVHSLYIHVYVYFSLSGYWGEETNIEIAMYVCVHVCIRGGPQKPALAPRPLKIYCVFPFDYYYLVCEAIGTAATPGLLCQPRVIVKMILEKHLDCRLAGETEVLGENLPQCHFCPSQNPTCLDPGLNPGSPGGKPATNRLSYGAASPFD
jgi:hypothetical protein